MFVGILFILMGLIMLLNHMGYIHGDFSDYFVPVMLIALGGSFIFKDKKDKA